MERVAKSDTKSRKLHDSEVSRGLLRDTDFNEKMSPRLIKEFQIHMCSRLRSNINGKSDL